MDASELFAAFENLPWDALRNGALTLLVGVGVTRLINLLQKGIKLRQVRYPFRMETPPGWVRRWLLRTRIPEAVWKPVGDATSLVLFFALVFSTFHKIPLPSADVFAFVAAGLATLQLGIYSRRLPQALTFYRWGIQFRGDFVPFDELALDRQGDSAVFTFRKTQVTLPWFRLEKLLPWISDDKLKMRIETLGHSKEPAPQESPWQTK